MKWLDRFIDPRVKAYVHKRGGKIVRKHELVVVPGVVGFLADKHYTVEPRTETEIGKSLALVPGDSMVFNVGVTDLFVLCAADTDYVFRAVSLGSLNGSAS